MMNITSIMQAQYNIFMDILPSINYEYYFKLMLKIIITFYREIGMVLFLMVLYQLISNYWYYKHKSRELWKENNALETENNSLIFENKLFQEVIEEIEQLINQDERSARKITKIKEFLKKLEDDFEESETESGYSTEEECSKPKD